jgi:hypothetical protein
MAIEKIDDLSARLPNDYCRTVLAGGVMVLESENPIRAHLFAAALRELVGYLLHSAAPDEEILAASWYEALEDRPTRRQRATFAVQGGLSDAMVERLGIEPADMHRDLGKAVAVLNKRTHLRPNTLLTDGKEIQDFANEVVAAVLEFIETISLLRETVADAVVHEASLPVFASFLQESNEEVDILSGRSIVEGADVEAVRVLRIGASSIEYEAEGTIDVELNYGPRGDGVSMSDNFPFTCTMIGKLDPLESIVGVSDMKVDTSSFYK